MVHDSRPERVRFKVYRRNRESATAAHLDHIIEFKDYKTKHATQGMDCIEAEFNQDPRRKHVRCVAMRLDDACVVDRTYHPDKTSMIMRVIDNWQLTIGISEIVSALHRGEEIITTELQMNDSDSATLVVTRMFRVKDLQVLGQDEAEQRETVQKSDPMEQELALNVRFNLYKNRAIQMEGTFLSVPQALGNATHSQTYYPLQDQASDIEPGIKTRCEGCEVGIVGGGYYSNDNGTYGFCDLCIEKEHSAQGFRFIRSCTRCSGLCGAPAIQHVALDSLLTP